MPTLEIGRVLMALAFTGPGDEPRLAAARDRLLAALREAGMQ
jgi:hypothetical protein